MTLAKRLLDIADDLSNVNSGMCYLSDRDRNCAHSDAAFLRRIVELYPRFFSTTIEDEE